VYAYIKTTIKKNYVNRTRSTCARKGK